MAGDSSWDISPVVRPDLPARKRQRVFDRALLKDPVGVPEPAYQLADRDVLVVPSTLDRPSRLALLRTQNAIAAALAAGDRDGHPVPERTLLRHEWEIAVALREITDLRAEHAMNSVASPGPRTQAVLKPQHAALQRAQAALEDRVAALERYAQCVRAVEAAYHDWQDAQRVAEMNGRYLDLVARTAADEHAVAELSTPTEQVAALAIQHAFDQASLAAEALALPEATTS
jgi:hypothetical protein